jgi:hypothetical protein
MRLLEGDVSAEWFTKDRREELDLLSYVKEGSRHDNAMNLPQNSSTDPGLA